MPGAYDSRAHLFNALNQLFWREMRPLAHLYRGHTVDEGTITGGLRPLASDG